MKPAFLVERIHGITRILVVTILAGMAYPAHAQEVSVDNDSGVGARAMGMGGANIAAANDLSAVLYNPAALARLDKIEVQLGINTLKRDVKTTLKSSTEPDGTADTKTDYSGLGSIGLVYPVPTARGSLVFAVAYNHVKDFENRLRIDGYNDTLEGFQTGESVEEGGMGILSLAGALDVSPQVSFGASFDIWTGSYKRDNHLLLNDYRTGSQWSQLDITGVDDDISAWSFKPSVLYHDRNFRLGAFLRFPMQFHITERNYLEWYSRGDGEYFKLYEIIDPTSDFTDDAYIDHMSYTIKAPMQFGFGLSWTALRKTTLGFDFSYENWKQAKLDYPSDYLSDPNYFRDRYRSSMSWRIGLEQRLPFWDMFGRVGYLRQPVLFKGPRSYDEGAPAITVDNERDFITFGLGKQFEDALSVDAAVAYGFWSQKEEPRKDEETQTRFYVSVTYRTPKIFR
ncbi:outer membrane protein transport protein [bacterium]|nr:outer membrane protein transport protein [bacterium]